MTATNAETRSSERVLDSFISSEYEPNLLDTLDRVDVLPRVIEDFKPISECLEWKLSEDYWQSAGLTGFMNNGVPYAINNSGALSRRGSRMLFASCQIHAPCGRNPAAGAGRRHRPFCAVPAR
jgi:hypothetical protein